MSVITNPILPGFNPDPSICRAGEDYYIANSTFEWFPGVQIHHSKDLIHWRLAARPLDRVSQLDMNGCANSCGIWAPCLSYYDGQFWLIYTNVRSVTGPWLATPNHLVTAPSIDGPWSEPIYLNGSGFDPSLFHDDDGPQVAGEYDLRRQLAAARVYWDRPPGIRSCSEETGRADHQHLARQRSALHRGPAPLQAQRLVLPDVRGGGTGWEHMVSVARSRKIDGPYETYPQNPILTSYPEDRSASAQVRVRVDCRNPNRRVVYAPSVQQAGRKPRRPDISAVL